MGTREVVLTSTHDLCFRAKIKKNVYSCKPKFYYIKVGCKGVYIVRIVLVSMVKVLCNVSSYHFKYISTDVIK